MRVTTPSSSSPRHQARPSVEGLEGRELLSTAHVARPELADARVRSRTPHVAVIDQLPTAAVQNVSTTPANGDANPYGVAFVPAGLRRGGPLSTGDLLVSNFNNNQNLQGTGTTIVKVTPGGQQSLFFQSSIAGLDTGLAVLRKGFVLVGSVPSVDGTSATAGQGQLLVLNGSGKQVASFSSPSLLNGPWDLTVSDRGNTAVVFVSNVLSGTVTRLTLRLPNFGDNVRITSAAQIASGYVHHGDPVAFEVGPTGLAFNARTDTLYVASEGDNSIYAVRNALRTRDLGIGRLVVSDSVHLHGPAGLTVAPDGGLITANGDGLNVDPNRPSELVEYTTAGQYVGEFSVNPANGGAFGVAVSTTARDLRLAAVDDVAASVQIYNIHA